MAGSSSNNMNPSGRRSRSRSPSTDAAVGKRRNNNSMHRSASCKMGSQRRASSRKTASAERNKTTFLNSALASATTTNSSSAPVALRKPNSTDEDFDRLGYGLATRRLARNSVNSTRDLGKKKKAYSADDIDDTSSGLSLGMDKHFAAVYGADFGAALSSHSRRSGRKRDSRKAAASQRSSRTSSSAAAADSSSSLETSSIDLQLESTSQHSSAAASTSYRSASVRSSSVSSSHSSGIFPVQEDEEVSKPPQGLPYGVGRTLSLVRSSAVQEIEEGGIGELPSECSKGFKTLSRTENTSKATSIQTASTASLSMSSACSDPLCITEQQQQSIVPTTAAANALVLPNVQSIVPTAAAANALVLPNVVLPPVVGVLPGAVGGAIASTGSAAAWAAVRTAATATTAVTGVVSFLNETQHNLVETVKNNNLLDVQQDDELADMLQNKKKGCVFEINKKKDEDGDPTVISREKLIAAATKRGNRIEAQESDDAMLKELRKSQRNLLEKRKGGKPKPRLPPIPALPPNATAEQIKKHKKMVAAIMAQRQPSPAGKMGDEKQQLNASNSSDKMMLSKKLKKHQGGVRAFVTLKDRAGHEAKAQHTKTSSRATVKKGRQPAQQQGDHGSPERGIIATSACP